MHPLELVAQRVGVDCLVDGPSTPPEKEAPGKVVEARPAGRLPMPRLFAVTDPPSVAFLIGAQNRVRPYRSWLTACGVTM